MTAFTQRRSHHFVKSDLVWVKNPYSSVATDTAAGVRRPSRSIPSMTYAQPFVMIGVATGGHRYHHRICLTVVGTRRLYAVTHRIGNNCDCPYDALSHRFFFCCGVPPPQKSSDMISIYVFKAALLPSPGHFIPTTWGGV